MSKLGVACMPLLENAPEPKDKQWTKTICPVCGKACWETTTFKWAKQAGIIQKAACTNCAFKEIAKDIK